MKKLWFIGVLAFLSIMGCEFKAPLPPVWSVDVMLPLTEKTYTMQDLLPDSLLTAQGADSLLYFNITTDFDPVSLTEEDLSLQASDRSQRLEIGTMTLDNLQAMNTGLIPLRTLMPQLASLPPGTEVQIPETLLVPDPQVLTSDEYLWVYLLQGRIRITLTNKLPFTLGPNAKAAATTFTIKNDSTGDQIVQVNITDPIDPQTSRGDIGTVQDGGITVYNDIRVEYAIPIANPATIVVSDSLLDNAGIIITVDLEHLESNAVKAKIEPQEINRTFAFSMNTEHQIKRAKIKRGAFHLTFTNTLPMGGKLVYTFPNLFHPDGSVFKDSVEINTSTVERTITLDGLVLQHAVSPGQFIDSITVEVSGQTNQASQFVELNSTDYLQASVVADTIFVEEFEGDLAPESIQIGPYEFSDLQDFQNFDGDLQLSDVQLILTIFNEINVDNLNLTLEISGEHRNDAGVVTATKSVTVSNQQINPGSPGNPATTEIVIEGQDITDLINILPTRIQVSGTVTASGNADVSLGANVWGKATFTAPLKIQLTNVAPFQSDVEWITNDDIDQDLQDNNPLQYGVLDISLSNHTPFGGSIRLIISGDPAHTDLYDTTYFNPAKEIVKVIRFEPGNVDAGTGYVTQAYENAIKLELTEEEIGILTTPPYRVGVEARFQDTQGTVAVRSTDFLKFSGLAKFKLYVNPEEL